MFVTLLLFLNALLNFQFVSLEDKDLDTYRNEIVLSGRHTEASEICSFNIIKWGSVCKTVIQRLRSSYEKYKNLYVNYRAFIKNTMCSLRNVLVPNILVPIQQNSLPCYAGPKFIPVGTPNQFLQHYQSIIIFPYSYDIMMIFENIEGTDYYTFLEFQEKFEWISLVTIDENVFTAAVPKVYENNEAVYTVLRQECTHLFEQSENENNIVNFSDDKTFYELCRVLLRSEKYGDEIRENSITLERMKSPKHCQWVVLVIPKDNEIRCPIKACKCRGYFPQGYFSNTQRIYRKQMKFMVAATKDDNSVMLLENTKNSDNLCNLLEYYENVNMNYISISKHY